MEREVLIDNEQIALEYSSDVLGKIYKSYKNYGAMQPCDMCNYNAFYKYLFDDEFLYRCKGHKIIDISKLNMKFGF